MKISLKFSGSGDEVLKRFYKEYKKAQQEAKKLIEDSNMPMNVKEYHGLKKGNQPSLQQITEAKTLAAKLMRGSQNQIFSPWEEKVRKHLIKSNIGFEIKFRKFPLEIDNELHLEYIPDFVLKNHEYNGKRILIEAHEFLTDKDAEIYGAFMENYGGQYHLIMVVSYNQLRLWNELDQNRKKLFNDIWTIDDLEYFIKDLRKYESISVSKEDLVARIRQERNQIISGMIKPAKILHCIGCKRSFETTNFSQLYCFECLKYLN